MRKQQPLTMLQAFTILLVALMLYPSSANAYPEQEHYEGFLAAYGELLEQHIIPNDRKEEIFLTSVNYVRWSVDPLHRHAMVQLQQIKDPYAIPPVEQMAFWINIYNYLTVDLIVQAREKESIRNLDGLVRNVWQIKKWELFGKTYTLDEIEHKILRPMNEPRIHYAINCASLSCPDLRDTPYRGRGLFTQLEEQETKFIADPTKGVYVEFDATGKVVAVKVSQIFKWYKRDFTGKHSIQALLEKHKQIVIKGNPKYLKYNWELNGDW